MSPGRRSPHTIRNLRHVVSYRPRGHSSCRVDRSRNRADEARSLVAIWQPGFLHAPGLTPFYPLPQREYDRVTTIALDPVPETLVRVGIVMHAHAEPEWPAAAKEPVGCAAKPAEPVGPVGPAFRAAAVEKRPTVAEAEKLAEADHDLCLFGLSELSADVANALQPHPHRLLVPGLTNLDADVATALARHAGPVELPDLRLLDSTALARKLLDRNAGFAPLASAEITPDLATLILGWDCWNGSLPRCPLSAHERDDLLDAFLAVCQWVRIHFVWRPNLPDEADNHLLELAVAGGAAAVVTNNVRDLRRGELVFPGIRVQTPGRFLQSLESAP